MAQVSRVSLKTQRDTNFPDNTTGAISPALLRAFLDDFIDSSFNLPDTNESTADDNVFSWQDDGDGQRGALYLGSAGNIWEQFDASNFFGRIGVNGSASVMQAGHSASGTLIALWVYGPSGRAVLIDDKVVKTGIEYSTTGCVTATHSLTDKEYVDKNQLTSCTVGTLPTATPAGKMIYVSNETGGAVPAFSDGSNWRRVTDRVIVS